MSISAETVEYATYTMGRVYTKDPSSSSEFIKFSVILDYYPEDARTFIRTLSKFPDHQDVFENLVKSASEMFPQKAAGLGNAQVDFQKSLLYQTHFLLVDRWISMHRRGLTIQI